METLLYTRPEAREFPGLMNPGGKRVVIKVGTGVLTRQVTAELDHAVLSRLIQAVSDVVREGHQVLMVTSGAVGAGLHAFDLLRRPGDTGMLQACAAVGQARLMQIYDSGFRQYQLKVAQLLLTNEDFEVDKRRENVRNTIDHLFTRNDIVPIINENDSVAIYELKTGDNDRLSAQVARLVGADLLIVLTSVPGLYSDDRKDDRDIIREVTDIASVTGFVSGEIGHGSVGGMGSKLRWVAHAVEGGIEAVIADGKHPEQLPQVIAGQGFCTRFLVAGRRDDSDFPPQTHV
ncbi:MAG: glutamate 5-kinase [Verrucomicrobia bacterium]|nr:glutamate 5-kinase [Verrucomicrobiota bacterium]